MQKITSDSIKVKFNISNKQYKCSIVGQGEKTWKEFTVKGTDTKMFSRLQPNTNYTIECERGNCSGGSTRIRTSLGIGAGMNLKYNIYIYIYIYIYIL